jgi:hypothetical protein
MALAGRPPGFANRTFVTLVISHHCECPYPLICTLDGRCRYPRSLPPPWRSHQRPRQPRQCGPSRPGGSLGAETPAIRGTTTPNHGRRHSCGTCCGYLDAGCFPTRPGVAWTRHARRMNGRLGLRAKTRGGKATWPLRTLAVAKHARRGRPAGSEPVQWRVSPEMRPGPLR